MSLLVIAAGLSVLLVILMDLWAWQLLRGQQDLPSGTPSGTPSRWPEVAVLVAARNEEKNLPACLQSLLQLDYPPQKLHILLGDDASTDHTHAIAMEWAQRFSQIKVYSITENRGLARGKANVLAQLVHHCPASVQYFFVTDADIRRQPQWLYSMLQAMTSGVGLVSGTTAVMGSSRWARWQQADWAVALGLAKAYSFLPRIGRTLTAIGNNLLISRKAYEATGGYESMPFSITEDYELLQQVYLRGFKALHLMNSGSSATTEPVVGFRKLLHQRKRWMTGAMRLPWPMVLLLFVQALFFPAIVVLLWWQPCFGLLGLLLKIGAQFLLARQVLRRLGKNQAPAAGFLYEVYSLILNVLLVVFYFLPLKISWKDRTYQNNRS